MHRLRLNRRARAAIVGMNIYRLRDDRNWTQEALAQRVGVKQSAVSVWESGRKMPSAAVMNRLCEVFAVPLWRVTEAPNPTPELPLWRATNAPSPVTEMVEEFAKQAEAYARRHPEVATTLRRLVKVVRKEVGGVK